MASTRLRYLKLGKNPWLESTVKELAVKQKEIIGHELSHIKHRVCCNDDAFRHASNRLTKAIFRLILTK